MKKILLLSGLIFLGISLFFSNLLMGCSVPVFRYALERWQASPYELVVFYEKNLSETDKKLVKILNEYEAGEKANVTIRTVDVTVKMDEDTNSIWKSIKPGKLPVMVVYYPFIVFNGELSRNEVPAAWFSELSEQNIKLVMDSPVRREIARQILKGISVVFLLIESGDKKKDTEAENSLKTETAKLEKSIKLPDPVETDYLYLANLKLNFSLAVMKLSRRDPNEIFLISSLLNSSREMTNIKEPAVFPIFGKGRVFYPLTGSGIEPGKIKKTVEFLSGPCACTIKEQNPGMDLLMSVKWGSLITSTIGIDAELPPLKGLSDFAAPVKVKAQVTAETIKKVEPEIPLNKSNNLLRNVMIMIFVLTSGVFLWYIFYDPKNRS